MAVLWVWSDEATLAERFNCAQRLIQHWQKQAAKKSTSYQAFLKVLVRWTHLLVQALQVEFRKRMQSLSPHAWRMHGFVTFGVDGSRIDLPRTRSNQQAYAPSRTAKRRTKTARGKRRKPSRQKHASGPQLWLTMLFHLGLNLPWDWRIGPSNSSERQHALDMLESLPENSLLCGDAGFVGYEFAQAVMASGCEILVRVGANVTLLKKLGFARESNGLVYLWPDQTARRNEPPLVFRLVVVQSGRHPVYLITSVRNRTSLTDGHVADVYRSRWGVEVYYRHFKQTFGRRKLRSHAAPNARVELEWSLIGLWAIAIKASYEQALAGTALHQLSIGQALRAFRRIARDYLHPQQRGQRLRDMLRDALRDEYERKDKTSRQYPHKKREHPAGKPRVRNATRAQIQTALEIKQQRTG